MREVRWTTHSWQGSSLAKRLTTISYQACPNCFFVTDGQKLPIAPLYKTETVLSLALNFTYKHYKGSLGAIRGAINHLHTKATRAGVEGRWVVGVGQPASATTASTNAADEHGTGWPMRDECDFVATIWVMSRPILIEANYISIHQEASGEKGKWSLCLKSCSNDL